MMNDTEMTLIGEILLYPDIFNYCIAHLNENHFENPMCKRVYTEMKKLRSASQQLDPLVVVNAMGTEKEDYKAFLLECRKLVISPDNYKKHIELVRENALKTNAAAVCYGIACEKDIITSDDISERLTTLLSKFSKTDKTRIYGIDELHAKFVEFMHSEDNYIKTGFPKLDKNLHISKGDYIVVGGRPSSGKTALTCQMAVNMAKKYKVLYFSFETDPQKLWQRIISSFTCVDLADIKDRSIMSNCNPKSQQAWKNINNFAVDALSNINLKVVAAAGMSVQEMRTLAVLERAEVVFVDYLTLVSDSSKSSYERATKISIDLHTFAQSENISVIAVAQLNRQAAHSEKPSMVDLRESGQIEQDADGIILISDKRDVDVGAFAKRTLYLVKNKEGETGKIEFSFCGDKQRFEEA